jgi:hypothetical protein
MEPNYLKTNKSAVKGRIAGNALEDSPMDKRKAKYGE